MRHRFMEECFQHAGLRHPNIVQLMGVYFSPGEIVPTMVLEFLQASLSRFLETHPEVPLLFKQRILLDVTVGLRFLHERTPPIIHRDLTANNVLLTEDLRAKISDLGVARILPLNRLAELTKAPGNVHFMPPEAVVSGLSYDSKLDMFSLGALILQVVLQKWPSPCKGATSVDPRNPGSVIAHTEVERRHHLFDEMDPSDPLTELAKNCLNNDPQIRPSAQDVYGSLKLLVAQSTHLYFSSLEWFQRHKKVEEENAKLKKHSQSVESQVHKLLQDLSGKKGLEESDVKEVIGQLQSVLHDSQFGQHKLDKVTDSDSYIQPHKLVLGFKPTCSESEQSPSSSNSADLLLQLRSLSLNSPHPISLTLCRSFSHTFTGTYVKTVISGLGRCFGLAPRKDLLYVVDHLGWKGVHICNIVTGEVQPIIDSASSFEAATAMPVEKCWGPSGIALDSNDNIILADMSNHRIAKYSCTGEYLQTSGEPLAPGNKEGEFYQPLSLCLTGKGKVVVCDWHNDRIQVLTSDLRCERVFGKRGKKNCEFIYPRDVAIDSKGNIYIVDCGNLCVKVFSPDFEFLHKFGRPGNEGDGFRCPSSLCIDNRDFVYVTDRTLKCVKVFDPNGEFRMAFGGRPDDRAEFMFNKPTGIAVDECGHLFVSDSYNGRVLMYE